ncbi:type IV pilus modification PilV family protein [Marinomonas dokdonensis]|uniref:type IV pilus modification PilV family protein n=1 Tax=Marinomonas dokdonensis TaxID=328224 RepID=UPI00405591E4
MTSLQRGKHNQQGWMLLEVMLCLALLSFVLVMLQKQQQIQWQSLAQLQSNDDQEQAQEQIELLNSLMNSPNWLSGVSSSSSSKTNSYPNCDLCGGADFQRWFVVAQKSTSVGKGIEDKP